MPTPARSTRFAALLPALLLAACATTAPNVAPPAPAPAAAPTSVAHENLNAVLWMQRAAEYRATLLGSFNVASRQLERALAEPEWDALPPAERDGHPLAGLPPAVIVDADETMIDNSAFQARLIRDGARFSVPAWTTWTLERNARALPGALEFARRASELGVTVLFVTNRRTPEDFDATADNLQALGFPLAADRSNLLLSGDARGPGHEKGARREWAARHYRVLLMLGDNLGDFLDGTGTGIAEREQMVDRHVDWWGERWIMLPNPSYGSWESAVLRECNEALRADPIACLHSALRHD